MLRHSPTAVSSTKTSVPDLHTIFTLSVASMTWALRSAGCCEGWCKRLPREWSRMAHGMFVTLGMTTKADLIARRLMQYPPECDCANVCKKKGRTTRMAKTLHKFAPGTGALCTTQYPIRWMVVTGCAMRLLGFDAVQRPRPLVFGWQFIFQKRMGMHRRLQSCVYAHKSTDLLICTQKGGPSTTEKHEDNREAERVALVRCPRSPVSSVATLR
jgi:hypothetical protein